MSNALLVKGLSASGVTKRIGAKQIVSDVTFTLRPGTLTLLLGRNGAGKTTLLKIMATLLAPSEGKVHWDGQPISKMGAAYRRRLGVVFDQPLLYPELTALENLRFYARLYRASHSSESLSKVLDSVGLALHANERVRSYSRGMLQRLAIARSVIHMPRVLLWDEPLTAVDDRNVTRIIQLLLQNVSNGATALVVTHDYARLWQIADRVLLLRTGRLVEDVCLAETDQHSVASWLE